MVLEGNSGPRTPTTRYTHTCIDMPCLHTRVSTTDTHGASLHNKATTNLNPHYPQRPATTASSSSKNKKPAGRLPPLRLVPEILHANGASTAGVRCYVGLKP